ncbi:hypothetical protein HPB52_025418 [Rhipicephalus sanguineus]|uniref:HTH psq-type domain-containing protein n=1 Tax=Rhipicephalus sanguineus TaxID=34632 RepID=A0A9D4YRK2_RHISA|nr:hypothetical protein HPB52_025418 [Rhipicephalus sanguineus]
MTDLLSRRYASFTCFGKNLLAACVASSTAAPRRGCRNLETARVNPLPVLCQLCGRVAVDRLLLRAIFSDHVSRPSASTEFLAVSCCLSSSGFAVYCDGTDCSFVFVRAFEAHKAHSRLTMEKKAAIFEQVQSSRSQTEWGGVGISKQTVSDFIKNKIPARITFEGFADADKDLELCAELTDDEIILQVTEDSDESGTENEEPAPTQPTSSELTRALLTLSSVYSGNMTLTEIEADMIVGKRTVQKKISDFFAPKC